MKRINLDKLLAENPPSYGISEAKARKKLVFAILLSVAVIVAITFYEVLSGEIGLELALISLLIVFPIFLVLGGFKVYLAFYEIERGAPRFVLEQLGSYVVAFEPEFWAFGGRFVKFLVMEKEGVVYAMFFGVKGRLIMCNNFEETQGRRSKVRRRRLVDEFRVKEFKFRIYEVDSAIVPHPVKEGSSLLCRNCVEICWSSFATSYVDPDLLLEIAGKVNLP